MEINVGSLDVSVTCCDQIVRGEAKELRETLSKCWPGVQRRLNKTSQCIL